MNACISLFLAVLLLSCAYAQSMECPPGCECLSESGFQAKHSHAFNSTDLCDTSPPDSDKRPCPLPNLCFKNVSLPPPVQPNCSGIPLLSLDRSVAEPETLVLARTLVLASVAGLSNCENSTVAVLQGGCNSSAAPLCSCTMSGSSCSCKFPAPLQPGVYDCHACIGMGVGLPAESAPVRLTVEPYQKLQSCVSDLGCAGDSSCSAGVCTLVTGACGYASGHAWVAYACGPEPDCPRCAGNASCENRTCIANPLPITPAQKNNTNTTGPTRPVPPKDAAPDFILYFTERPLLPPAALVMIGLCAVGYWIYRRRRPRQAS